MQIPRQQTEFVLVNWRGGQVEAERLGAALLQLEKFTSVDPQHPLGGPDGGKDLICVKNGRTYIGAVFFPTTSQSEREIEHKFKHDLAGVHANNAHGFVFICNQKMTIGFRDRLQTLAKNDGIPCVILHLERIRSMLDSASGYAVRAQFLGVPMNPEEQIAAFTDLQEALESKMQAEFGALQSRFDALDARQVEALTTISELSGASPSGAAASDVGAEVLARYISSGPLSAELSEELLMFAHRAACSDLGATGMIGQLRTFDVWIGAQGAPKDAAVFVPPAASTVQDLIADLLIRWNDDYARVSKSGLNQQSAAIASFHSDFMAIHPFADGNGRVARLLMLQQVSDLIGPRETLYLESGERYDEALLRAQRGDFEPLTALVLSAIES